jgi:serine/threonine protein kinase
MLSPGTVFAQRYEILRTISAGGMGTVYEVLHRETRRRRALKVMLPNMLKDADLRRRFALEAQVTADVESEHIVETFDAGIDADSGSPFLVMELLRGEDLGARLMRLVRLTPQDVVGLLVQAADALDKTHEAGIVHRDLKPENLFAVAREGTLRLKLLDFGIAKVVRETEVGKATRSMGTPLYMAPEQFEGEPKLGPRVDLYALAHIGYTLLVGEPYWTEEARELANALALMKRVSNGATEPATTRASRLGVVLPAAFDGWFERATALDPDERFPTASATIRGLAEALGVRAALSEPVLGTVPATDDASRGAVITPAGGPTPRDLVLGSQTTQAEPERQTPGGTGSTTAGLTRTRPSSRVGIPIVAALAALSIGITYLLLRSDAGPTSPAAHGSTSSGPTASPTPAATALADAPTLAPASASAPADPVAPAPSSSPAATLSAEPRPRPAPSRPSTPTATTQAPASTPAPPTPPAPPPAEPWRTR